MATASEQARTPGSILASERFHAAIEDGLAERPARYPYGAAFVGADMPGLGNVLARNAREGRAIVLVYPDGEERVLEPHEPTSAPTSGVAVAERCRAGLLSCRTGRSNA